MKDLVLPLVYVLVGYEGNETRILSASTNLDALIPKFDFCVASRPFDYVEVLRFPGGDVILSWDDWYDIVVYDLDAVCNAGL